jgi:hypothetical protein
MTTRDPCAYAMRKLFAALDSDWFLWVALPIAVGLGTAFGAALVALLDRL